MTDLTKLSDEQLTALYRGPSAAPTADLSGMSDEELTALHQKLSPPPIADRLAGVAKAGGTGLAEGGIGIAGLPGDLQALTEKFKGTPEIQDRAVKEGVALPTTTRAKGMPTSADIKSAVEGWTGPLYQPKTKEEEFTRTIGQFAPGAAFPARNVIQRVLGNVVAPAMTSETAGQATKGTPYEPYARAAGGVAGALLPSAAMRAVTPLPASPTHQRMVEILAGEGVHPTAGQRTGSKALQYAESALGDYPGAGGGASAATARSGEEFTRAALRRIGVDSDRALPEVLDQAGRDIGNRFNTLAQRNTLQADPQFGNDLQTAWRDYSGLVNQPNQAPAVRNFLQEIVNHAQGGNISGEAYQSLRSRIEATARSAARDPYTANALRDMREALDGAMERSIQASNSGDLGAWQEARGQYRNLLAIEKAATGAGENTAEGLISPKQLRGAAVGQGRRAYARGQGDFADLARAGEAVMSPLPQSGTGPRVAAMTVPGLLGASVGHMVGGGEGATLGATLGTTAAATVPSALGRALMSPVAQRYLGNQQLAEILANDNPRQRALAQALLAAPRLDLQLQSPEKFGNAP